jgi:glycosyltransferase involved in cell wall biosynthesis
LKIAILSPFYPLRGGIADSSDNLFEALERNHDVSAYSFSRQYPRLLFPGHTQFAGPGDHPVKFRSIPILDSINPLTYFQTANRLRQEAPDLLIIAYWMSFFAPSLGTVARRLRARTTVVSMLHNIIPHEPRFFDRPFTRYFLKQSHGYIVMSSAVERDLLTLAPPAPRYLKLRLPLFPHFGKTINPETARARLGLPEGKRTILFFGFIRDYKGLDLLIRAFHLLDDRYTLLVAGEAYGGFEKYNTLINSSALRKNIFVFNEYIDDSRVPDFFCAADVCVLPYRSGTQSAVTSVAYNFNVPVIATDVGGLREDVGERGTGLVVGSAEPSQIAGGIRRYFDDGLKAGCVRNIAAMKREENWDRFAEKVTAFAESL